MRESLKPSMNDKLKEDFTVAQKVEQRQQKQHTHTHTSILFSVIYQGPRIVGTLLFSWFYLLNEYTIASLPLCRLDQIRTQENSDRFIIANKTRN